MRPFGGDDPAAGRPSRAAARAAVAGRSCRASALLRFRHRFVPVAAPASTATSSPSGSLPGGRPLVLFTRPEHAKEIFAGDPEVFHAGKGNAILGPIMGEHSLLLQDSAEHKRARKLLMPAFNGHALREYEALVTDVAQAEVVDLARGRGLPLAGPDERAHPRGDPARRLRRDRRAPARRAAAAGQPRPSTSARRCCSAGATRGCSGSARGRRTVDNQRRARPADVRRDPRAPYGPRPRRPHRRAVPADPGRTTAATRSTDTELRDQLVTLLLAGHETTATALAWALYEVGRDPEQLRAAPGRRRPRATTPGWRRCSRSRCGCTR